MPESIPQDKEMALLVAFHVIVGYFVVSGMGTKLIEDIKKPIETKLNEKIDPPQTQSLVSEPDQQNYVAACAALEQYANGVISEDQLTGSAKELMEEFRDVIIRHKRAITTSGQQYTDLDSVNQTLNGWQKVWQARGVFNGLAASSVSTQDIEAAAKAL